MYVCMYVYIYACMHVCMYVCMHAIYIYKSRLTVPLQLSVFECVAVFVQDVCEVLKRQLRLVAIMAAFKHGVDECLHLFFIQRRISQLHQRP